MISNYIDRIDAFGEDLKFETEAIVSALERLAGELRVIETAKQNTLRAIEVAPENDHSGIDAAIEIEKATIEQLPKLMKSCEREAEDLLKLLTIYIPQVFEEITCMLVEDQNVR